MTDAIDPISYKAGIEAAAKIVGEAYEEYQSRLGDDDVIDRGYLLTALASAEVRIGKLHLPEPQTAPDTNEVPTRYKPGEIVVRDGIVRRFIEAEIEGEKWKILGTLAPFVHPDHAVPADAERLALAERIAGPLEQRVTLGGQKFDAFRIIVTTAERDLIVSSLRAGGWREDMQS